MFLLQKCCCIDLKNYFVIFYFVIILPATGLFDLLKKKYVAAQRCFCAPLCCNISYCIIPQPGQLLGSVEMREGDLALPWFPCCGADCYNVISFNFGCDRDDEPFMFDVEQFEGDLIKRKQQQHGKRGRDEIEGGDDHSTAERAIVDGTGGACGAGGAGGAGSERGGGGGGGANRGLNSVASMSQGENSLCDSRGRGVLNGCDVEDVSKMTPTAAADAGADAGAGAAEAGATVAGADLAGGLETIITQAGEAMPVSVSAKASRIRLPQPGDAREQWLFNVVKQQEKAVAQAIADSASAAAAAAAGAGNAGDKSVGAGLTQASTASKSEKLHPSTGAGSAVKTGIYRAGLSFLLSCAID